MPSRRITHFVLVSLAAVVGAVWGHSALRVRVVPAAGDSFERRLVDDIVDRWSAAPPSALVKVFVGTRTTEEPVVGLVSGHVFTVEEDIGGHERIGSAVCMAAKNPPRGRALYFATGGAISKSVVSWTIEVQVPLAGLDADQERRIVEKLRARLALHERW